MVGLETRAEGTTMKWTTMKWTSRVWRGIAVLAATASAGAAQDASFEWGESMAAGERLRVQGIVGEIRAEYTEGRRAEVVARKEGRSGDYDQVEIRTERRGNQVIVCAIYRPERVRGEGCSVDHDGDDDRGDRGHRRSIDVEVDFTVRVPAGVDFEAVLVSGDVVADDLHSDVEVSTVNGDIEVSTSGRGVGRTVNGSIDIAMDSADWSELDFGTVSGDITLWLPDGIETDVEFQSLSGDIESDFEIATTRQRSRWIGATLEGYIGSRGRRSLSFNTVSGDVRLRRPRS